MPEPLAAVEVETGLPLVDQILGLSRRETNSVGFLDLGPDGRIAQRAGRQGIGGVVWGQEVVGKRNAVLSQVDLGLHPIAREAFDVGGRAHGNGQAHQVRKVDRHLLGDEGTHGKPRQHDGRLANRFDDLGAVAREVGDRPGRRSGYRFSGAPRIVGGGAEGSGEARHLQTPGFGRRIAARYPDEVGPAALLRHAGPPRCKRHGAHRDAVAELAESRHSVSIGVTHTGGRGASQRRDPACPAGRRMTLSRPVSRLECGGRATVRGLG